jgi:crotonobetainyl-CoA:carnitine CoA-transferase CaiB-like acyl-CoA transferase
MSGPLTGLTVVELCDEMGEWAGKLLADMGATVVKVEPPGGVRTRGYEPFLDDTPGPERSLWFWHYNTNKQSVVLDVEEPEDRAALVALLADADVLLEDTRPGRMADLALDWPDMERINPKLIYVSITAFGRGEPRNADAFTDLTLLAGGGPAWSCGYDDHALPPVRGGGNQGYQTACHYAVMSLLVALLERDVSGRGQHIDVNAHAASNVTTEAASYTWLVNQQTVQRQTGRHAGVNPSQPAQILCADGRYATTGLPPRRGGDFVRLLGWLDDLGLKEEFEQWPLLELGVARDRLDLAKLAEDPEVAAIFGAGRECVNFLASRLPAYQFFAEGQQHGFQVGVVYSPEEVLGDPHFQARGFPVEVSHDELGRSFVYPGAPYRFEKSQWEIRRRAPLLGEDSDEVLARYRA